MLPWKAFSARSRLNVQIINLICEPKLAPLSSSTSKLGTIGNVCTLPWTTLVQLSSNANRVIHRVHKNGSGPHIAFMARGAPGDIVRETLKTEYCESPFGELKLNLVKIRNKGEVRTNA